VIELPGTPTQPAESAAADEAHPVEIIRSSSGGVAAPIGWSTGCIMR
jgi:hypothetical protein